MPKPPIKFFLSPEYVEKYESKFTKGSQSECWNWKGTAGVSIGYGVMDLRRNGKTHRLYAHRVSYVLYVGSIPKGMCVCHTCDNPLCVNPNHLWLGTLSENIKDMWNKGRGRPKNNLPNLRPEQRPRGSKHGMSKLHEDDVRIIRKLYTTGTYSWNKLARNFGVHKRTIGKILHEKTWTHVK